MATLEPVAPNRSAPIDFLLGHSASALLRFFLVFSRYIGPPFAAACWRASFILSVRSFCSAVGGGAVTVEASPQPPAKASVPNKPRQSTIQFAWRSRTTRIDDSLLCEDCQEGQSGKTPHNRKGRHRASPTAD